MLSNSLASNARSRSLPLPNKTDSSLFASEQRRIMIVKFSPTRLDTKKMMMESINQSIHPLIDGSINWSIPFFWMWHRRRPTTPQVDCFIGGMRHQRRRKRRQRHCKHGTKPPTPQVDFFWMWHRRWAATPQVDFFGGTRRCWRRQCCQSRW